MKPYERLASTILTYALRDYERGISKIHDTDSGRIQLIKHKNNEYFESAKYFIFSDDADISMLRDLWCELSDVSVKQLRISAHDLRDKRCRTGRGR